jgi:hypothetical protein
MAKKTSMFLHIALAALLAYKMGIHQVMTLTDWATLVVGMAIAGLQNAITFSIDPNASKP